MEPGSGEAAQVRCADVTAIGLAPCPEDAGTPRLVLGATVVPQAAAAGATTP